MITLNHKQAQDVAFLSGMEGGKSIHLWETLHGVPSKPAVYAECNAKVYWLRPRGKLLEMK